MNFAYLIEPPFNFKASGGGVIGSDVELAQMVCAEIGDPVFEPIETEFAQLLPGVAAGRWDMTTGLFATDERRARVAFSRPIWAATDGLLIHKEDASRFLGYASLAQTRARVAVIRDQLQHRRAVAAAIDPSLILVFETYLEAAAAVRDGRADAYPSVWRAHRGYLSEQPDAGLDIVEVPVDEAPPSHGCFAFAPENDALRRRVDAALSAILGGAAHRDMMGRYGFDDAEIDRAVAAAK